MNETEETKNTPAPEAAEPKAEAGKVVGKLFMGFKKPKYVTGYNSNGKPYEFIATQVSVGEQVHDLNLDLNHWDEIAAAAAPSTTVLFSGTLEHSKNPYIVNAMTTEKAYERLIMRNPELLDIIDSKGSAIAFKRGARLPSSEELKRRAAANTSSDTDTKETTLV